MYPPHDVSRDDERFVDYLLDRLPPADAERLDEATLVDDELAARLRIVEHDLIDAYARGSITGERLARFESHYLSSTRRRQQVQFARTFVRLVDRAAAPPQVDAPRQIDATPRPRMRSISIRALTLAATILLVASLGLLVQAVRLGRGLAVAERERALLEARANDLERKLADARSSRDAAARQIERPPQTARPAAARAAIALVLAPPTRAIGPTPSVAIPVDADSVGFELRLESNDFSRYQVGLRDPAVDRVAWRSGWTSPRSDDAPAAVVVSVPADVLKPQHYSLDLMAKGPDGDLQTLGSYAFEVVRR